MKMSKMKADVQALLFLLPFLAIYLLFTIWPMLKGVEMSFYKWSLIHKMEYLGLSNYEKLWQDQEFWASVGHSFILLAMSALQYWLNNRKGADDA
ncbi:hypothetical protein ACFSTH_12760 [Paenibacillus yanchengensis]|uniref:Sugar ABC transporter permease n=1 Tax=Paenibacillus yanchengensis TaxID=2035833 RepID=A0ABW4YIR5_9BACL